MTSDSPRLIDVFERYGTVSSYSSEGAALDEKRTFELSFEPPPRTDEHWEQPSLIARLLRKPFSNLFPYSYQRKLSTIYYVKPKETKISPVEKPPVDPTEVIEFMKSARPLQPFQRTYVLKSVTLGKEVVVKQFTVYPFAEAMSLAMVRSMTTIPVPRVLQVTRNGSVSYVVMEYIQGRTLAECWSELGLLSKLRIAWTLRGYVKQIRRLRRTVPSNLDDTVCEGPFFTHYGAGPFASYADLVAWFNHKLAVMKRFKRVPEDAPAFDDSYPLVFCHQDLCLRNIMLADDGTLFVIDWQWAGFYPIYLEYAGMMNYPDEPRSWRWLIPFIAGNYKSMCKRLNALGWALNVAPFIE